MHKMLQNQRQLNSLIRNDKKRDDSNEKTNSVRRTVFHSAHIMEMVRFIRNPLAGECNDYNRSYTDGGICGLGEYTS